MNSNIIKKIARALPLGAAAVLALTACNPEPDESNLYTFTGQTAEDFIVAEPSLTAFHTILSRVGLERTLASYGQYTVFAPNNDGVYRYIDQLFNDTTARIPHNGVDVALYNSGQKLEALTDSLCSDIARYHMLGSSRSIIDMGVEGGTVNTMLGVPLSTSIDSLGQTVLNGVAAIISQDNEVTNGYVHIVDNVAPRNSRVLTDELERHPEFSIFFEALKATGLGEMLKVTSKAKTWENEEDINDHWDVSTDGTRTNLLWWPKECKKGFTIFAETDAVMNSAGIHNFAELVEYANRVYANAADWYSYLSETGNTVSTGNDYTNRFNALNMFVAYHIVDQAMPQDQMVFEFKGRRDINYWNYVNDGEPQNYYETMLPNTLMKLWQPNPLTDKQVYINRWKLLHTLTDEVGTQGSEAMHPLQQAGVRVTKKDIQAYNGYVHPIQGMLVYDYNVPNGVLYERMRFDTMDFMPEFQNNNIRYATMSEVSAWNGGGSGARVAFPLDFFDGCVCYNEQNKLRYNVKGAYNAYNADTFQGWGLFDLSIKMPPLPTGSYEVRINWVPMSHGSMVQFFWGTSSDVQQMVAMDIPIDARIGKLDPRIGWTKFYEEEDQGIATDAAMRNRGYMRGLYCSVDHPENAIDTPTTDRNLRGTDGNTQLRKILGRVDIKQSERYWLRLKNTDPDGGDHLKWQVDFIEFVPVNVVDNPQYAEDWF